MARTAAIVSSDLRIGDYIAVGLLTNVFPLAEVRQVLADTGKHSLRERDLPAHIVVYYVLAMALFMHVSYREVVRCLLQGLQWVFGPEFLAKVPGKSGISQARTRLGSEPMKALHDKLLKPIAVKRTKGAWYQKWRLVSLDGSTFDLQDTEDNSEAFGRPENNQTPRSFPQLRFVTLLECGTRIMFGARTGGYRVSERMLAMQVVEFLKPGMLCLADRYYYGYDLWKKATETGAQLVWRGRSDLILPCVKQLKDGSYCSVLYPSTKDRRLDQAGIPVRIVEYTIEGVPGTEPAYRIITSILDESAAPAKELAALYHERWEIEIALDELKTHLRGPRIILRSKTPELVRQEFYGLLMTHFAIRGLIHEAALEADEDPDELSYVHAVRVIRRTLPQFAVFSPR